MIPSPITSSSDLLFHRDSLSGTHSVSDLLTTGPPMARILLIDMPLEAMTYGGIPSKSGVISTFHVTPLNAL